VDGRVDSIAFAPCGTKLAAACNIVSGGGSFSVQIFSKDEAGNFVWQSALEEQHESGQLRALQPGWHAARHCKLA